MTDRISKAEIRKDAVQDTVTAAAGTVGQVATIVTAAVGEVVKAVGGLATEVFEIRDAARKAAAQHDDEPDRVRPTARSEAAASFTASGRSRCRS